MDDRLDQLLGTEYPIVLAPFGGVSSIELTTIVSQLGGLGSYGLYGYSADQIAETFQRLRAATSRPFAVNLWLPTGAEQAPERESHDRYAASLAPFFDELDLTLPPMPDRYLPAFEDQIEAVLELGPAVISFVFGVPPADVVTEAHRSDSLIFGTATTVDEALALEEGGVDAIVATGAEAAGRRGTESPSSNRPSGLWSGLWRLSPKSPTRYRSR